MTDRTILVTGATGNVGRHVVAGLRRTGVTVRALSRRPDVAGFPAEVELVPGDLYEPDSVASAAEGADAAFLLWPAYDAEGARAAVDVLAKYVSRIVYLSASGVQDDQPPEANGVWGVVEDLVQRTGLEWTFLRAGGFATNTLEWAEQIRTGDVVRMPFPAAGRSLIHERDIAAVAVEALLDDRHIGQKYLLTGPETLTQTEQLQLIGDAIGRRLRVEEQTAEEARQQMLAGGTDPAFVEGALSYWSSLVEHPEAVTRTVEELTGQPARTFRTWATEHAGSFQAG